MRKNVIALIDEGTGRKMEGRQWSDGLHQAVMARERVMITPPNQTTAVITAPAFFGMYEQIAGMTGTADPDAAEFKTVYDLDRVVIPTNKPNALRTLPDELFVGDNADQDRMARAVELILEAHREGRPILIGTQSIKQSEFLRDVVIAAMQAAGLPTDMVQILNAKSSAAEARIVAQAGQKRRYYHFHQHGRPRHRHPTRRRCRGAGA